MSTIQISVDDDGAMVIIIPPEVLPLADILRGVAASLSARAPEQVSAPAPPPPDDKILAVLTEAATGECESMSFSEIVSVTGFSKSLAKKRLQQFVRDGHVVATGNTTTRRYTIAR